MAKWMTADWTIGQLNALVKKMGNENARGVLDGTVEFVVTARAREFLRPAGELTVPTVPATKIFDPTAYFQTRQGLWIADRFKDRVLKFTHEIEGSIEITPCAFDLVKPANNAEIRSELPEDHVFEDSSEFCHILAQMINQQSNGEEGNLLTNGYWNIFYVRISGEVCAVDVYWDAGPRLWDVDASSLDAYRWRGGSRAFSRNC